jgi:hypothetical protein
MTSKSSILVRRSSFILLLLMTISPAVAQQVSPDACLYLPPWFASRVVFYDGFDLGDRNPEINRAGAQILGDAPIVSHGFAGKGCRSTNPAVNEHPLNIRTAALSAARPLTVMRNWRLDAPMTATTSFQLIALLGKGHISCFVHGAGEWCALTRPTMFVQIDSFPRIANVNQAVRDNSYFQPGQWHNITLTIANASDVRFYLDGQPLVSVSAQGRHFDADDIQSFQPCGDTGRDAEIATTSDDLIIVDRVLSPAEIAQYWQSAMALKQMNYPPITH